MASDPACDVNRPLMPAAQGKPAGSAATRDGKVHFTC